MKSLLIVILMAFASTSFAQQYEKLEIICTVKSSERNTKKLFEVLSRTGKATFCVDDKFYNSRVLADIASKKVTVVIRANLNHYSGISFVEIARSGTLVLDVRKTKYYSSSVLLEVAKNNGTIVLESSLRFYSSNVLVGIAHYGSLILINDDNYYTNYTLQRLKDMGARILKGPLPSFIR